MLKIAAPHLDAAITIAILSLAEASQAADPGLGIEAIFVLGFLIKALDHSLPDWLRSVKDQFVDPYRFSM